METYLNEQNNTNCVLQRPNDPFIYLWVMGEWYCYNPSEPPLGSGAMGTVFLGYRCKNGEKIAVKRVKDKYANIKEIRDRAKQEAALAFRHDNLIEMIGYCEYNTKYGPIYILSKYVSGTQIDTYLKSHWQDSIDRVERICTVIYAVLKALEYIHTRGVIHRDVKPSNIMIEDESNIRLMDLGIARMNKGNKYSLYGFIGTPQYAAPEQITRSQKSQQQLDATTDIYATGITFYELLTGENPFDMPSDAETMIKQMTKSLPYNDKIPRKLMSVIWKATEKKQSKRFQTSREFRTAIEEAITPQEPFMRRFREWIEEHLMLFMGVMIVLVCMIILLFYSL